MESNSGERGTIINSEFLEKVPANSVYKANNWRAKECLEDELREKHSC